MEFGMGDNGLGTWVGKNSIHKLKKYQEDLMCRMIESRIVSTVERDY